MFNYIDIVIDSVRNFTTMEEYDAAMTNPSSNRSTFSCAIMLNPLYIDYIYYSKIYNAMLGNPQNFSACFRFSRMISRPKRPSQKKSEIDDQLRMLPHILQMQISWGFLDTLRILTNISEMVPNCIKI